MSQQGQLFTMGEQRIRVKGDSEEKTVKCRITGYATKGERPYMEDRLAVSYLPIKPNSDVSRFLFIGVLDGHGGDEAANFAKQHLMDHITQQRHFESQDDDMVLKAIKDGYLSLHTAMANESEKWKKTASGLPSTAGTTASVAFIRNGKLYVGHVGDSRIVLGRKKSPLASVNEPWEAVDLTNDHKPEDEEEEARILAAGGRVIVSGNGIPRVALRRLKSGHKGPIRRSTSFNEIPFLSVARSLGDYWSYVPETQSYAVSPIPDVAVVKLDPKIDRCLILASDGLWNVVSSEESVECVQNVRLRDGSRLNASASLVDLANIQWKSPALKRRKMDNISVLTAFFDYPDNANLESISTLIENMPLNDVDVAARDCRDSDARNITTKTVDDTLLPSKKESIAQKNEKQVLGVQGQSNMPSFGISSERVRAFSPDITEIPPQVTPIQRKINSIVKKSTSQSPKKREMACEPPIQLIKIGQEMEKHKSRDTFNSTPRRFTRNQIIKTQSSKNEQQDNDGISPIMPRSSVRTTIRSQMIRNKDPNSKSSGTKIRKTSTHNIWNPLVVLTPIAPPGFERMGLRPPRTSRRMTSSRGKELNQTEENQRTDESQGQRRHSIGTVGVLKKFSPEFRRTTRGITNSCKRVTRSIALKAKNFKTN